MTEEIKDIRVGPGVRWKIKEKTGFGTRETSGYTIDNLNTKSINEAENLFEQIFILTRGVLEQNDSSCMDNESERLQCCQDIAKVLQHHFAKIRNKKGY